jgi:predicted dehydrogenase
MMTDKKIGWGIIGAGLIAHKLADAVLFDPDSELVAVASKSPERAQQFAVQYGIAAMDSYEDLVQRDDVDVVYIATTHNFHYENALLALRHKKHLLVEKPFTVNALQAAELIGLARSNGCFMMEAIWVRFLPSMMRLKQILDSGAIGEIRLFNITFGGIAQPQYLPRLTDPKLAGGVTLDMGIYPITFVNYLLGARPEVSKSLCRFSKTGVDELATYQFQYASGCIACVNTSFNLYTPMEAMIYGSMGYIQFPHFQFGTTFHLHIHNGTRTIERSETITEENHGNGFIYQVAEVVRRVRAGELESPIITWQETLETMQLMDNLRAEWGFVYPFE